MKFIPPGVTFQNPDNWPVFSQPGDLLDYLKAAGRNGSARCVYVPKPMTDLEEHFECVVRIVRAAGNLVFYIDEVNKVCSRGAMKGMYSRYWSLPENKYRTPAFQSLIDDGRHAGVALVMMTRFPSQVNTLVRSNCQEMRVFRSSEGNVVDYFGEISGEMAKMIPALGDYEYVLWQDGRTPIVSGGREK